MKRLSAEFFQWLFWLMLIAISAGSLLPLNGAVGLPVSDKWQHFAAYLLLGGLAVRALGGRYSRWLLGFGLVAFSGVIELLQGYSGYRHAEWLDLLANSAGTLAGLALLHQRRSD